MEIIYSKCIKCQINNVQKFICDECDKQNEQKIGGTFIYNTGNLHYEISITSVFPYRDEYEFIIEFEFSDIEIKNNMLFKKKPGIFKHYNPVNKEFLSTFNQKYWVNSFTKDPKEYALQWINDPSFMNGTLHYYGPPSLNITGAINRHIKGIYFRAEGLDYFENDQKDDIWCQSFSREFEIIRSISTDI